MPTRSEIKVANLERLQQVLIELADEKGVIRGTPLSKLTEVFNERYKQDIKPIHQSKIRTYLHDLTAAGWLTTEQEQRGYGRLTLTIQQPKEANE